MGEPVRQRRGHLGVAEDGGPFAESEVDGDDDRALFVEAARALESSTECRTARPDESQPGEISARVMSQGMMRLSTFEHARAISVAIAGARFGRLKLTLGDGFAA